MPIDATIPRLPLRRMRAHALAGQVFNILYLHAPYPTTDFEHAYVKAVRRAISEAFETAGIEVLSDYDRQQMGLPPRGPDGWTAEEIALADMQLRNAMLTAPPMVVITKEPGN